MDTIKNTSWLFLLSVLGFCCIMCSKLHLTSAADTISLGDSLTGDQTIISKDGNFELGFFKPGKSQNHYIGIWYKKVSLQTVVWVANRDAPILDPSSSKFTLSGNGNLVLLNSLIRTPIWSTHLDSNTLNTPEAVLGDDGNLVLRDGSNPSVVIWQSFDYPTDTLLPGAKLGFSKITNQIQQLTSWRNQEDPATGPYNWLLGPNRTRQLVIYWNKSEEIWKSGEWNEKTKTFSFLPEMRLNYEFKFNVISNINESYFSYSLNDKSMIARFVIDSSGQIKEFTWLESKHEWIALYVQPKRLCDVYSICGPFGNCNQDTWKCECLPGFVPRSLTDWNLRDSTGGCTRKTLLQCENKDGFLSITASKLPDMPRFPPIYGAKDCKSACESSCGCIAYAFVNNGCRYWGEDLINFNQFKPSAGPAILNLKLAATDIPSTPSISSSPTPAATAQARKRKALAWKIGIPVLTLVATIMGVLGYIYLFNKNKANKRGRLKGVMADLLKSKANNDGKTKGETQELQIFDLACLANATTDFCVKNKLGEGGFGPVYKGILKNEQEIAVKRLSKSSGQGIEEFKNEVLLISKLQHRNLVKLLGCCVEGEEYMLIYEYMPKKSLDAFLFDPRKETHLDWGKRFNIIGGIVRGLLYLHRDSRLRVIHRDLKVSNILLDENLNPKISDFGMARIFGGDQIIDNTDRVVGTFGYMSPEYVMGGTFSEKSDVFSFGVLVLEIVSSKRNNSFYNPEQPSNLIIHAWRLWNEGKWSEVVDEGLGDMYSPLEVIKCIHIGLLCVQNRAIDRPTMAEVENMLANETDRPTPKEPPYTFPASSDKPGSEKICCSSNDVTFTEVEGR